MGHGQPSQRNSHVTDNRRVTEGGVVILGHTGYPSPGIVGGRDPQQRAPHRPSTSSMSGPSSFWPPGNSSIYSPITEKGETARNMGSIPLYPPLPATPLYSYRSAFKTRDLGIASDSRREPHDGAAQTSRSAADLNEGAPSLVIPFQRADRYPYDHTPGRSPRNPYEQQAFENLESGYISHSNLDESADQHSIPLRFNDQSTTPGRRGYEDQLLVTEERSTPVPHHNGLGMDSYVTTGNAALVPGGPPLAARIGHYNPHFLAISYHSHPQSDRIPTSSGPGGGRTVELECTRPSDPHRLGNGGMGDVENLVAVPPNPRSDGSSQPLRVQGSGKGRKAKLTTGQDEAVPTQKFALWKEPGQFRAPIVQLSTASAATPDHTYFIMVPQSWYKCTTKQSSWVKAASIEFGGIKLTDAANKSYRGLHGCDDGVLKYDGVGSSIQCRLNFSGKEIGRLKILTTNSKSVREPTTKKKLAFEVAKLVRREVEAIRAEPDCNNITFENLVLVRLVHVSKSSWQPTLWYEVAGPYLGPP